MAVHPRPPDPLHGFTSVAAIVLVFLLVFGLVGGWLLAGRMLAPLGRITDATRMAATGSLSHRIELEGRQDEFRELADAFDRALARLEAHVAEQQRFAANASHELRTPLAITQSLLDVARKDPNRDAGELVDRLYAVNARAIELSEALLVLSRADQRSFTRDQVDLSLVAEEAAETLLPFAEQRDVTIETSGDVAPTKGSRALLLQLTTNLVHNAIVHNLPEQGTVWVTTGVDAKRVELTVENTGQKLTSQSVSTLAAPFQRGTERIRTDHAGVGLGLAIVKSIAQAHDGTLALNPEPPAGCASRCNCPSRRRTAADEDCALQFDRPNVGWRTVSGVVSRLISDGGSISRRVVRREQMTALTQDDAWASCAGHGVISRSSDLTSKAGEDARLFHLGQGRCGCRRVHLPRPWTEGRGSRMGASHRGLPAKCADCARPVAGC